MKLWDNVGHLSLAGCAAAEPMLWKASFANFARPASVTDHDLIRYDSTTTSLPILASKCCINLETIGPKRLELA